MAQTKGTRENSADVSRILTYTLIISVHAPFSRRIHATQEGHGRPISSSLSSRGQRDRTPQRHHIHAHTPTYSASPPGQPACVSARPMGSRGLARKGGIERRRNRFDAEVPGKKKAGLGLGKTFRARPSNKPAVHRRARRPYGTLTRSFVRATFGTATPSGTADAAGALGCAVGSPRGTFACLAVRLAP